MLERRGGSPPEEIIGKENPNAGESYLRMTLGHLRSLYRDIVIRREFSDLGISFPVPDSGISEFHIPVAVINAVGENLHGRSLRTLKMNIGYEVSNNLHHAWISTYGTIVGMVKDLEEVQEPDRSRYINIMRFANDALWQMGASNELSDRVLPDGYQRHTKKELADVTKQLLNLNDTARAKGLPVDEILKTNI